MEDERKQMRRVTLNRIAFSDEGTRGTLQIEGFNQSFATMELPWRDNKTAISCIPEGTYNCVWAKSTKFGMCYHVTKVPGRSSILFHNGNWAGDHSKGFRSESLGCVLIGLRHGILIGQRAVLGSIAARTLFESAMNKEPFKLTISSGS